MCKSYILIYHLWLEGARKKERFKERKHSGEITSFFFVLILVLTTGTQSSLRWRAEFRGGDFGGGTGDLGKKDDGEKKKKKKAKKKNLQDECASGAHTSLKIKGGVSKTEHQKESKKDKTSEGIFFKKKFLRDINDIRPYNKTGVRLAGYAVK